MIDASQFYTVAAAVVLLVAGLIGALVKWQATQSRAARAQMRDLANFLAAGAGVQKPSPDGSGGWSPVVGCSVDCRRDVLTAIERVEGKLDRTVERLADAVSRHRVRLALLEQRAGLTRDKDAESNGPR